MCVSGVAEERNGGGTKGGGGWSDEQAADRIQNVLWRIANGELDGITPKAVVLMIGTNNLKGGDVRQPPAEVRDGVAVLVKALRERLPNARIVLCGILPRQAKK